MRWFGSNQDYIHGVLIFSGSRKTTTQGESVYRLKHVRTLSNVLTLYVLKDEHVLVLEEVLKETTRHGSI